MNNISIKIDREWLSLQSGFEWNNILRLAIITGINGVGKTHLVKLFQDSNPIPQQFGPPKTQTIKVFNSITNDNFNIILPTSDTNQNIKGLIDYFKNTTSRSAQILQIDNNIRRIESYILSFQNSYAQIEDRIQKESLSQQIQSQKNNIESYENQKNNLIVFAYEEELKAVAKKVNKDIDKLSEDEIREKANPFFYNLTEIQDFQNYLLQSQTERRDKLVMLAEEKRHKESDAIVNEPKIFKKINQLFLKFGFTYFEMQDPFPTNQSRNGEIGFLGKKGESVQYENLSDGEKMIVKFIIWAYAKDERGNRINTMVLDEPDAHLHPKMCKMMIDILDEISKSKEEGGSGIRIIITTHSPSTVAFAPEGSLFVMEKNENNNRSIRPTTNEVAMAILSEGIFTYDKAVKQLSQIADSSHKNILFVEGKTDIPHLKKAMQMLNKTLDLETFDIHDAVALASFIKNTPAKLFKDKKLIALFDNDLEGIKEYNAVKGNLIENYKTITATQCEGKSYACLIVSPDEKRNKYCPIEFLYPLEFLKEKTMLNERNFQEYKNFWKNGGVEEDKKLNDEYEQKNTYCCFTINDNNKNSFSLSIETETKSEIFKDFLPTIELIEKIIKAE